MATTKFVDPISRIEGHLGVRLTVDDTSHLVTEADCHGNLWRGFENFLIGRVPNDAITFTQRICGVCPVPHGTAATYAVESVMGYNDNFQTGLYNSGTGKGVPAKALHVRNLILASEFLMSSMTHFYHLAAPSYVQGPTIPPWTPYFAQSFYSPLLVSRAHGIDANGASAATSGLNGALPANSAGFSADLWSAVIKQYVKALRIRRLTFEAGAMFGGRMPMTSAFIAGGIGLDHTANLATKTSTFFDMTAEIGKFIVKEYVPLVLALGALYADYDNAHNSGFNPAADVTTMLSNGVSAGKGYGAGCGNFLAWGSFPQTDGSLALFNGWKRTGLVRSPVDFGAAATGVCDNTTVAANLKEHIKHSRYGHGDGTTGYSSDTASAYPGNVTRTIPKRDDNTKYSWLKAPRWADQPMEVGPMARMFVMNVIQENVPYATSVDLTPFGLADYMAYTVSYTGTGNTSNLALNPAMVEPDLAVALVRSGLAELRPAAGGAAIDISGLTHDAIAAAYTAGDKVITGIVPAWIIGLKGGLSTMDRLRGRAIESLYLVQKMIGAPTVHAGDVSFDTMGGWCAQLAALPHDNSAAAASYSSKVTPITPASGFGAAEAPRGALMHFCSIDHGKISAYQCVVPTTWNGAPKDGNEKRGPIEQAMIGIPYASTASSYTNQAGVPTATESGVEALRVAQSFDPCIACAVH
jgi:Ni,Fe-hydrogenase I large subunit